MKQVEQAPVAKQRPVQPDDDWKALDEIREAFKDAPPEEIEREVAKAIAEGRAAKRARGKPAPRER
jgi:hypothetical protein